LLEAMMQIVKKLPRHVKLSPHLRERAPFYVLITHFGLPYYIPGTPKIRRLLELDANGRPGQPDRRLRWRDFDKADALRDIVAALSLQVRDVELAGIEQGVTQALLDRMAEVMRPTVRGMIDAKAVKTLPAG
jgi:hypothetical protein